MGYPINKGRKKAYDEFEKAAALHQSTQRLVEKAEEALEQAKAEHEKSEKQLSAARLLVLHNLGITREEVMADILRDDSVRN